MGSVYDLSPWTGDVLIWSSGVQDFPSILSQQKEYLAGSVNPNNVSSPLAALKKSPGRREVLVSEMLPSFQCIAGLRSL